MHVCVLLPCNQISIPKYLYQTMDFNHNYAGRLISCPLYSHKIIIIIMQQLYTLYKKTIKQVAIINEIIMSRVQIRIFMYCMYLHAKKLSILLVWPISLVNLQVVTRDNNIVIVVD